MNKKFRAIFFSVLLLATGLSILAPTHAEASPLHSNFNNSVYLNGTLSGFLPTTQGSLPAQTLTINAPQTQESVNLNTPLSTSWTENTGNTVATIQYSLGSYRYSSGTYVALYGYEFKMAYASYEGGLVTYLGTVWANLTIGTSTFSFHHTFGYSGTDEYAEISASWLPSLSSGTYSVSLEIQATGSGPGTYGGAPAGGETSSYGNFPLPPGGEITSTYEPQGNYGDFMHGWSYSSTNSNTYNPSLPPLTTSYHIYWTSQYISYLRINGNNVQSGTSGNYSVSSGSSYGIQLQSDSNPDVPSYTGTAQITDIHVENAVTQSIHSGPLNQNSTENGNWWNSSLSHTFSDPSGWTNSASYPTRLVNYTLHHILSAGNGTSPEVDNLTISGSASRSINMPSQYSSLSASPNLVENSAFTLSFDVGELINYDPQINGTSISYVSGSTANLTFTTSEQISQSENIVINWGDGQITNVGNVTPGSYFRTHQYSGTYSSSFSPSDTVSIEVTNLPDAASTYGASLSTTKQLTPYKMASQLNPTTPNTILSTGSAVYMYVNNTNLHYSSATATVDGQIYAPGNITNANSSQAWSVSATPFGRTNVVVVWTLIAGGITATESVQYGTELVPTNSSHSVTVVTYAPYTSTRINKANYTYSQVTQDYIPITITNNGPSTGNSAIIPVTIDSATYAAYESSDLSNVLWSLSGSAIPSWIQSGNSNTATSTVYWLRIPEAISSGGSVTVHLNFAPLTSFLFSPGGDQGEYPTATGTYGQYDNGALVFPFYENFAGTGTPSGWKLATYGTTGTTVAIDNGLNMYDASTQGGGIFYYNSTVSTQYDLNSYVTAFTTTGGTPYGGIVETTQASAQSTDGIAMGANSNGQTSLELMGNTGVTGSWSGPSTSLTMGWGGTGAEFGTLGGNLINSTSTADAWGNYYMGVMVTGGNYRVTSFHLQYLFASSFMQTDEYPTESAGSLVNTTQTVTGNYTNITNLQTTQKEVGHVPFSSYSDYGANPSYGEYVYQIPDSFNSNNLTIYYNTSWSFVTSSYGNYQTYGGAEPHLYLFDTAGVGEVYLTFLEPVTIAQPLGSMSIGVFPSIAVNGIGFSEWASTHLHWEAASTPVSPNGFSVVIGKPIQIKAYTVSDEIVYNQTYTPTQLDTYLQTTVNITEFQFNNLNSTTEVQIQATNNGHTQKEGEIGAYGTASSSFSLYVPSGNYTFTYTELNATSGAVITTQKASPVEYDGMYWVTFNGFTVFDLGNQLSYENSTIQKSIQTLSIQISLNDSAIRNLTLGINLNLTATNSSLQHVLTDVLVNQTFIRDHVLNYSNILSQDFNITHTIISSFQSNVSVVETYTNDTVNFIRNLMTKFNQNITLENATVNEIKSIDQLNFTTLNSTIRNNFQAMISNITLMRSTVGNLNLTVKDRLSFYFNIVNNSFIEESIKQNYTDTLINTSAYVLDLGAPQVNGEKYIFPVYVDLRNSSAPANLSTTQQAANNLKVIYAYMGSESLNFKISNLSGGFFDLGLTLTSNQVSQMANGSFISLSSPIKSGTIGTIATGKILGSNLPPAIKTWYEKYLGISSPPPGGIGDLTWFVLSVPGILSTGILGAFIVLIYTRNLVHGIRKERKEEEREDQRDKDMQEMKEDIKELKKEKASEGGS